MITLRHQYDIIKEYIILTLYVMILIQCTFFFPYVLEMGFHIFKIILFKKKKKSLWKHFVLLLSVSNVLIVCVNMKHGNIKHGQL